MVCLSFAVVFVVILEQYFIYKTKYIYYEGSELKGLYIWSIKSAGKNKVAVTLDSDLLINLPPYSPLFMYVPAVRQTTITHEERYQRFFETLKYYGMTLDDFSKYFDGLISYVTGTKKGADSLTVRRGLMSMVLFGSKSKNDKKAFVQAYRILLERGKPGFTFKADYWIVSRFDQQWVKSDSMADKIQKSIDPIFKNDTYVVYKLPEKMGRFSK